MFKKKHQLNARQIATAKELGMRPKKFGSMAPNKSEPLKGPLGEFIGERTINGSKIGSRCYTSLKAQRRVRKINNF
ncbi:hypothetical protein DRO03_02995 [Methanosarcinales archaeon]|nr:MAG: hypothetical protein DRO03_02995 [Methanosarcinales archaeon]